MSVRLKLCLQYLAGLPLLFALNACFGLDHATFLEPTISSHDTKSYSHSIEMRTDGLALIVYSPSKWDSGYIAPWPLFPFIPLPPALEPKPVCNRKVADDFLVYFSSAEEGVTFSPMQVALILNGSAVKPIGFDTTPLKANFKCVNDVHDLRTVDQAVPVESGIRFRIFFSGQPGPHSTLSLRGLSQDGIPIVFPDIHYEYTSAWSLISAP